MVASGSFVFSHIDAISALNRHKFPSSSTNFSGFSAANVSAVDKSYKSVFAISMLGAIGRFSTNFEYFSNSFKPFALYIG